MDTLWHDLRYALRTLAKSPGFTVVAVLTLALGIGANTAIFSVVDAVLLKRLPYRDPARLVMVWENNRRRSYDHNTVSTANFLDWHEQSSSFEDMALFYDFLTNLTGESQPEQIPAQGVSANLFSLLGVPPLLGRDFTPQDARPGAADVVILSYGVWQRRFGGDPAIVGKPIQLNAQAQTVIGVMPHGFDLFVKQGSLTQEHAQVWLPIAFSENFRIRRGRFATAIARLKPGVSLAQAQAEMDQIARRFEQQYPAFNTGWGVNLVPVEKDLSAELRPALLILLGAVGLVLLITCANVANLLLSRSAARQRELAVRIALGATRWRLARQLLTESVLLALAGGGAGLLLTVWGVNLLLTFSPKNLLGMTSVETDFRLLGFALGASFFTGILFGLAPAFQAASTGVSEALKEGGRGTGSRRSHRLRGAFAVAQLSLALILLIGSGLLIRSFLGLQTVNPGFNAHNLLTARLILPNSRYPQGPQRIAFFRDLLSRIRALPGVEAASANSFLPFTGLGAATGFTIVGRPAPLVGQKPTLDVRVVDSDYFRTMGIPLLKGRTINERESSEPVHVVIINETMARQHWPDEDPLGKQVIIEMKDENVPSEIIGIVGDVKHVNLDTAPRAMAYWPHPELAYPFMGLVVRTSSDPMSLAPAVRQEVLRLDKDQPLANIATMDQILADSIARNRFSTLLLGIFAALAFLLAVVGVYGVLSYTVTQRTSEIGIRMALGARAEDILRLVLSAGLRLALLGLVIGVFGALALTRVLSTLLFGVSATDPLTFAAVAAVLFVVTLAACAIPALRASRVDPLVALRYE